MLAFCIGALAGLLTFLLIAGGTKKEQPKQDRQVFCEFNSCIHEREGKCNCTSIALIYNDDNDLLDCDRFVGKRLEPKPMNPSECGSESGD